MTHALKGLTNIIITNQSGYRLINSKYPPIALFDDVADEDEFELLYALQALTNPRLSQLVGNLTRLDSAQIPFGIPGCSYAVAPFTHVNTNGSRFSGGDYGMLYLAEDLNTAIAEVAWHQQQYWQKVQGLKFERIVMRGLHCRFDARPAHDACGLPADNPIYDPQSYHASRALGQALKQAGSAAIRYYSVRHPGSLCWGLFTPAGVKAISQCAHYEFVWDGLAITSISQVRLSQPMSHPLGA